MITDDQLLEDRLRWLVLERGGWTLDRAVELAAMAPKLLKIIEKQRNALAKVREAVEPEEKKP